MADPLQVQVVAADRMVWSGEATMVIAKTVDGDIGILAGHEPVLAVLVPGAVEIVGTDGDRLVIAVDGGFISMADGRVSVLSEFAAAAGEVSLAEAERELADAAAEAGDEDEDARKRLARAQAQVKAAQKVA